MLKRTHTIIGLDVGEKRIGVAVGDTAMGIAMPYSTIDADGTELAAIADLIKQQQSNTLVIGYPRNQSGEPTAQTEYVETFAKKLSDIDAKIVFQDESLTSVLAEQRLKSYQKPYAQADIDAEAAAIILQDYLEAPRG